MKKALSVIAIIILIMQSSLGSSQNDSSGIYFTAKDFANHKLSFAINCKTEKHTIKADMLFDSKEISIKHNDIVYKYPKDSVYAIKYCDGTTTRIYDNSEFPLINPYETIMIYKVTSIGTKGASSTTKYYFSKDAKSKIEELTIHNIKAAFPDNHKFHDLIDLQFHNDNELAAYDEFHKIMKINRILNNSMEK
jgi:hypothetical protein